MKLVLAAYDDAWERMASYPLSRSPDMRRLAVFARQFAAGSFFWLVGDNVREQVFFQNGIPSPNLRAIAKEYVEASKGDRLFAWAKTMEDAEDGEFAWPPSPEFDPDGFNDELLPFIILDGRPQIDLDNIFSFAEQAGDCLKDELEYIYGKSGRDLMATENPVEYEEIGKFRKKLREVCAALGRDVTRELFRASPAFEPPAP